MKVTIDGREVEVVAEDDSLIEVFDRVKIGIPAPCYRSNRFMECCGVCVVLIDGKSEFACVTKPVEGMNVTFNRADLKELRTERAKKYRETSKGFQCGGKCDSDCSESSNGSCWTK